MGTTNWDEYINKYTNFRARIYGDNIPKTTIKHIKTIQKYYKLFNDAYENHRTSAYINLLDVLPNEINFKVAEEEAQAKHTTKIKNEKKTELKKVFQSKVEQLKKKHQPHTDEIKRFAVSPEVLGFYFYKNEEDIKDKLFVFS